MAAMLQKIVEKVENLVYPELRAYSRSDRARLLKKASESKAGNAVSGNARDNDQSDKYSRPGSAVREHTMA